MPNGLQRVKHIVVLMLENRSFDHMLGYLKQEKPDLEGLTGSESNPVDPANPASRTMQVSNDARYSGDFSRSPGSGREIQVDPGHEFDDIRLQVYAPATGPTPGVPTNRGFVADYAAQKNSTPALAPNVMKCFAPQALPVLSTLAREFAICDHWFSSVPGPTWPNRLFAHTGSSEGRVGHKKKLYGMPTIQAALRGQGRKARIYAGDIAQSLLLKQLLFSGIFHQMNALWSHLRTGKLADYSFIEPDYFGGNANDQHPPHDVAAGERLIADVYEALRASSYWEQSLLVIVWDEHGGLFDHVTPGRATPPDGKRSLSPPFDFDRFGVRVPAVVVSPFIAKGTIDHTEYDHTSIIATVRKCFGIAAPLTQRDANANTLEGLLTLSAPRADTPLMLERPPRAPARAGAARAARAQPLSDLQRQLLALADLVAKTHARAGIRPVAKAAAPMKLADEDSAKAYVASVYAEETAVSNALDPAPSSRPRPPAAPRTPRGRPRGKSRRKRSS